MPASQLYCTFSGYQSKKNEKLREKAVENQFSTKNYEKCRLKWHKNYYTEQRSYSLTYISECNL